MPPPTSREGRRLERLYYNPANASGFSSVRKLAAASLLPESTVRHWLQGQSTYSIHRARRKHFPTNFYRVLGPNRLWELDLVITANIAEWNKPFTCLLTVIDVFDKFAWVEPLRSKRGVEVTRGFAEILKRAAGRRPARVQFDSGTEFLNQHFKGFLAKKKISYRTVLNLVKSANVERLNRSLRDLLWRAFYYRGSYDFRDILQSIVTGYNNSVHSATGYPPSLVREEHVFPIYMKNYERKMRRIRAPRYQKGQFVRLARQEDGAFSRGYTQSFSEEVFRIGRVQTQHSTGMLPNPLYHLVDLAGDVLKGAAYQEELVPVQFDPKLGRYKIERVLDERRNGREVLVKFLGYPNSMNKWIPASSLGPAEKL